MQRNLIAFFFILLAGTILGAVVPQRLLCQSVALTTEDLVQRADVIIIGKVTAMNPEWSRDRSRILTRVTIAVDQHIKGEASENSVTVTIPGGEVDGIGEVYSHFARFKLDEQVVVFAAADRQGQLQVVGGDEGKATVRREQVTGRQLVSDNESLQMFTAKLKRIVEEQAAQH